MNEEQFNKIINELLEEQSRYEVGSEGYTRLSGEILKWQKAYQEFQDSITEYQKAVNDANKIESDEKINQEKNETAKEETKVKLIIGLCNVGAILGLGAFCTIWSAEAPITNKIATTLMSFVKPKI